MNAQQRGPYLSSAKDTNVASRAKIEPRNCLGQPLAAAELKDREAAEQQMKMKRSIDDIILKAKARHGEWSKKALPLTNYIFLLFNSYRTGRRTVHLRSLQFLHQNNSERYLHSSRVCSLSVLLKVGQDLNLQLTR